MNQWRANKSGRWEYKKKFGRYSKGELLKQLSRAQSSFTQIPIAKELQELDSNPERKRISPYQARDKYLAEWFKWSVAGKGAAPIFNPEFHELDVELSKEEHMECLRSGQRLLELYEPLIASLAAQPYGIEEDAWVLYCRSITEPEAKDCPAMYPNRNPQVLQRELFVHLQLEFLEAVLRYNPNISVFSSYIKAALKWSSLRWVQKEIIDWGFGISIARFREDGDEIAADEGFLAPLEISLEDVEKIVEGLVDGQKGELLPSVALFIQERLTKRQREIFELAFLDDISPTKIAELLGVTQPAISKTLKRIKQKLTSVNNELNFKKLFLEG